MKDKLVDLFFFALIWPIARMVDVGHFIAEFKAPRFKTNAAIIPPDRMLAMLKGRK